MAIPAPPVFHLPAAPRACRSILRIVAAVVVAASSFAPGARAEEPSGTLTGFMFYATDTEGTEVADRRIETKEATRFEPGLRSAFPARHFFLIGRHSAAISQKYSIWLKPSPQFPLQIENTGMTDDGGLALYWILWQKEPLPTKDRELVKSNTILKRDTPIFIGGPKWRNGRLIFVVRMD